MLSFCHFIGSQGLSRAHDICLTGHVELMCSMAYSKLEEVFIKCGSGDITLCEVKEIKCEKSMSQLRKLCDIILLSSSVEEKKVFNFSCLEHIINLANAFLNQRRRLRLFGKELQKHQVAIKGKLPYLLVII